MELAATEKSYGLGTNNMIFSHDADRFCSSPGSEACALEGRLYARPRGGVEAVAGDVGGGVGRLFLVVPEKKEEDRNADIYEREGCVSVHWQGAISPGSSRAKIKNTDMRESGPCQALARSCVSRQ